MAVLRCQAVLGFPLLELLAEFLLRCLFLLAQEAPLQLDRHGDPGLDGADEEVRPGGDPDFSGDLLPGVVEGGRTTGLLEENHGTVDPAPKVL
eukprot:CAMPEP_0183470718 /NCGR_PEP_ID=MMETSP0370-20130417/156749_1 /TAXON_ID=268820 /ORGANISM="Peridinium aciculiferum, Strain PAER-2" /LENGTH=92 /DNA_ID=CAMNT_0025663257 /DNA_START=1 /DNA_END=275 /DNA_ORIENTATION=-